MQVDPVLLPSAGRKGGWPGPWEWTDCFRQSPPAVGTGVLPPPTSPAGWRSQIPRGAEPRGRCCHRRVLPRSPLLSE